MRRLAVPLLAVPLLVAGLLACASSGASRSEIVSDADFARLGPDQTGPVTQARADATAARDALGRAKLRALDVKHEEQLAQADRSAAKADVERARAEMQMAQDTGDAGQLARARDALETAQLRQRAADAHLDFAQQQTAARQKAVDAAEKQVAAADARVNWAKLSALEEARIPAANKYDVAAMQKAVAQAQNDAASAQRDAQQAEGRAQASQFRWQDLLRQAQARANGAQRG